MLLRSLVHQIAGAMPDYGGRLHQLKAAAADLKTSEYRNVW